MAGNVSAYDWTVLYTGRVLDDESGLYYYRMRCYHPALGVFVSRDPARVARTCSGTVVPRPQTKSTQMDYRQFQQ